MSGIGTLRVKKLHNGLGTSKHLKDFGNMFFLTNLASTATCSKSTRGTVIDFMLKNRPNFFKYTCAIAARLSDCHTLILFNLRAHFKHLTPKQLIYRAYHYLQEKKSVTKLRRKLSWLKCQGSFLRDFVHGMIRGSFYQSEEQLTAFST